jgi:hypothetical protein
VAALPGLASFRLPGLMELAALPALPALAALAALAESESPLQGAVAS